MTAAQSPPPTLASLGWDGDLDAWAEGIDTDTDTDTDIGGAPLIRGRLARVDAGYSLVYTGDGEAILAASGSSRAVLGTAPATGDFVVVADHPDDGPVLVAIADRRTVLQRRAPGRVPEPQVLAVNADTVLVLHGCDRPVNLRRLERLLVVGWDSGATPIVLLTKADLVPDQAMEMQKAVAEVAPGVEVLATSVATGQNLDRVAGLFADLRAVALLGPSGVGKSSLVNALSGGLVQRIGEVRATDQRGRHTTVTRDLVPLPGGGFVIDAPGVRELGLWQAYEGLDATFPEIAEAATACRFADCSHRDEPGCAVVAGLADQTIALRRLDHWQDLVAELTLQEEQLEETARRTESRDRADAEERRDRTRPSRRSQRRRNDRRRGRR